MKTLNRRSFLKSTAMAVGAGIVSRSTPPAWAQPVGANNDIRLAVIGLNRRGPQLVNQLIDLPGARVVALCDVDPVTLEREVERLKHQRIHPFATTDARKIMDRPDVDAVVIVTSNHWHALQTVWACQAGKDVYVEKPVSRTVWEGRKMVEAAGKYGRIVQTGTQYRSAAGLPEAIAYLREGHLGRIQFIHTAVYRLRESIGRRLPWYPDWLDYDLFCGPTPMAPLVRDRLDYDWHWQWNTGNGELGNNGIHALDIARRFAGYDSLPRRVMSVGGFYVHGGAAETPNTHLALFDYSPGIPVIYEGRAAPSWPGTQEMDLLRGVVPRNGVAVVCEGGYFAGYDGGAVYDHDGRELKRFTGDAGAGHMENFLAAVRSRRTRDLAAPLEGGHASTSLCHFGNISYRLGQPAPLRTARQSLEAFPAAVDILDALTRHLAAHGVNLARQPLTLGPWLRIDPAAESIAAVEGADTEALEYGRFLLKETQRPPHVIPEKV